MYTQRMTIPQMIQAARQTGDSRAIWAADQVEIEAKKSNNDWEINDSIKRLVSELESK